MHRQMYGAHPHKQTHTDPIFMKHTCQSSLPPNEFILGRRKKCIADPFGSTELQVKLERTIKKIIRTNSLSFPLSVCFYFGIVLILCIFSGKSKWWVICHGDLFVFHLKAKSDNSLFMPLARPACSDFRLVSGAMNKNGLIGAGVLATSSSRRMMLHSFSIYSVNGYDYFHGINKSEKSVWYMYGEQRCESSHISSVATELVRNHRQKGYGHRLKLNCLGLVEY